MTKKVIAILLTITSVIGLVGCGKAEPQKEVSEQEYYKKQVAETMQESEEIEETKSIKPEGEERTNLEDIITGDEVKLVEALPEIKESKVSDQIVQVYNAILPIDGSITVGKMMELLTEGYGSELTISELYTPDGLATPGMYNGSSVDIFNDKNEAICQFSYYNAANVDVALEDCVVTAIYPETENEHALNFFYAGNMCAGIFEYNVKEYCPQAYAKRAIDYPELDIDSIHEYLEEKGFSRVETITNEYSWGTTERRVHAGIECGKLAYQKEGKDQYAYKVFTFVKRDIDSSDPMTWGCFELTTTQEKYENAIEDEFAQYYHNN